MTKLWAISDLHVGYSANQKALETIEPHLDDWLMVAGDVGESPIHLEQCFDVLQPKFKKLIWVPGNHELYTLPKDPCTLVGEERYLHYVEICRKRNVITPEDPYIPWPEDPSILLVPLFLFYDYSFAPDGMNPITAKSWALEDGLICNDENYIQPTPHKSFEAWCHERLRYSKARLDEISPHQRLVLINHYPLRGDLVFIPRVPRFRIWCGTQATENWHLDYPVEVAVSGHLHVRSTQWRDGVRFEEVSLGYPKHWQESQGPQHYLRQILPNPFPKNFFSTAPVWHR